MRRQPNSRITLQSSIAPLPTPSPPSIASEGGVVIPQELIGTIPGWITAATAVSGLSWAFLKFGLGWRSQTMADEADIRDHYAAELDRYLVEVKDLRTRLDEADKRYLDYQKLAEERWAEATRRHDECLREKTDMREEIDGLKRQIARYSGDQALLLQLDAPEAKAAVSRVRKIVGRK